VHKLPSERAQPSKLSRSGLYTARTGRSAPQVCVILTRSWLKMHASLCTILCHANCICHICSAICTSDCALCSSHSSLSLGAGPVTQMSYCARHATINLTRLIAQHCFFLACAADECLGRSDVESNHQGHSSSSSRKCMERQDKMLRHLQQPTDSDEFINVTAETDSSHKYPTLKFNETCGGVSDVIARRLLGAMAWLKVRYMIQT
jgi:hypothetical protein